MPDEVSLDQIDTSTIPDVAPTEDVKALKSAYERLKAEVQNLKPIAKQYEVLQSTLGEVDPTKLAQLKEAEAQRQKLEEELSQRLSAKETELQTAFQKQLQAEREKVQQEQTARVNLEKSISAQQAYIEAGGKPEAFEAFLTLTGGRLKYDPDKKSFQITNKDGSIDENCYVEGKPMTLEQFVTRSKADPILGNFFYPDSYASGGGTRPGLRPGATGALTVSLSDKEAMDRILRDPKLYAQLKSGQIKTTK